MTEAISKRCMEAKAGELSAVLHFGFFDHEIAVLGNFEAEIEDKIDIL